MTISPTRIACWITKATNTHSEYVTLIVFPLQQWLYERASLLRYTYTACLVFFGVTQKPHLTHFLLLCVSYFGIRFSFSVFMFTNFFLSQPRQVFLSLPPPPHPLIVDLSSGTHIQQVCSALRLPASLSCIVCVDNTDIFAKSKPTAIFKRNASYGSTVEAGGFKHDAQKSVSGNDVFLARMLASPLAQVNRHASAVLL